MLLSFFEQYGNSVILSVDDLRQIRAKDNENFYYIGKFILGENERNTVLIDYIVELVRGYFVMLLSFFVVDFYADVIRVSALRLFNDSDFALQVWRSWSHKLCEYYNSV